MGRSERIVFVALVCAVCAYVMSRAYRVPMVHDECASVLWFVQPGEWLPHHAHADANNHFLSSGIGVGMYRLFGPSILALRLGSVLAFLVFAWAAYRLGELASHAHIRWVLLGALLLCPFVLDFFSLFRGYALGLAGWLVALHGLFRYTATRSTRHLAITLIGMLFADAVIVAFLPVWVIILTLTPVLVWTGRARIHGSARIAQPLLLVAAGLIPLGYAMGIALDMKEAGLLYHGSTDGFFSVTVQSLCRYVLGDGSLPISATVVALLLLSTAIAVREFSRSRTIGSPLVLAHIVMWSDVLLRILMAAALGVNFPEDRAGVHFVPLAVMCIAFAIDKLVSEWTGAEWAALLLLVLPARTIMTANMDHTELWPEQSIPVRFMDHVTERQGAVPRPLVVGGYHQSSLAWPMNASWQGRSVFPLQATGFPDSEHDLRIVDERWFAQASTGYHVLDSATGPGLWLLERDAPLRFGAPDTVHAPARSGTDEFMDLAALSIPVLRAHEALLDVRLPVHVHGYSPDVLLVIELTDSAGTKLRYAAHHLTLAAASGNDVPFRVAMTLTSLPTLARAVVYLYNPQRTLIRTGPGSVALAIRTG